MYVKANRLVYTCFAIDGVSCFLPTKESHSNAVQRNPKTSKAKHEVTDEHKNEAQSP